MTDLPAPLTPPECDLRDFAYMPLDVVRLRDSDLAAIEDAEVFRAAVLAWCVAWHQIPAGSLPDNDSAIARLIGMGRDVKGFKRLRDAGALHKFVKCSDGRLYHPTVAEKALSSWGAKKAQRDRTEKARAARLSQSQSQTLSQGERCSVTETVTGDVTGSKVSKGKVSKTKRVFVSLPDWIPAKPWEAWVEMRRKQKKPLGDHARDLAISELTKLKDQGYDPEAVVNLAVMKGWLSFYPTKDKPSPTESTPSQGNTGHVLAPGEDHDHFLVRRFKETGYWASMYGAKPTDPNCDMPAKILIEFGYREKVSHETRAA